MKKGMNFTNSPTKNPAAKNTAGLQKSFFLVFTENRPFFEVLYDILCKNRFSGYKNRIFCFSFA